MSSTDELPLGEPVDGAPALRPRREEIRGRHVALVPFDPDIHARLLFEATRGPANERLWAYMGAGPFEDFASFEAYSRAAAQSEDPLFFAIVDALDGHVLGHASYMRIDTANRVIEVGNVLYTPALMRTPAGTEAMYLMARHAFEVLGYRRYEWKCNALNAPSRRAAERYGFRFEGVFRHHMIVKGRNRDTAWFSILAEEWPQRAVAMERWLAADNFDAKGRQIVSLAALNADRIEVAGATLRRAQTSDLPAIEALQKGAYGRNRVLLGVEPLPLTWDYAEVLGEREVWLLDAPGRHAGEAGIAGVLLLSLRAEDLLVDSLAVAPMAQGGGVGNVLLEAAEARANALGRTRVRLYTGEALTANINWYRRKGFVIERVEQMADRRLVHLAKSLR